MTENKTIKEIEQIEKGVKKEAKSLINYVDKNLYKVSKILLISLLAVLIINVVLTTASNITLSKKAALIKELNKPSIIQLSIIDCVGCRDITPIIDSIKNKNVDITEEKTLEVYSNEAKTLIEQYKIPKLPAVIISGEIDKLELDNFKEINDALLLDKIEAPYLDIISNDLKGKVSITEVIDSSCEKCRSLSSVADSLGQSGVFNRQLE